MSIDETLPLKFRIEAILFASPEPLSIQELAPYLPEQTAIDALLLELQKDYENRGIRLKKFGEKWGFRTSEEMSDFLSPLKEEERKLSRAALETLTIIAYHQPVTRAEIEAIRGVQVSRGTLDILTECNWIKPGKRSETLGRAMVWETTNEFLDHFSLSSIEDLPGINELREAGFMPDLMHSISMEKETDSANDNALDLTENDEMAEMEEVESD